MGSQIESVQRYFGNHFPEIDKFHRETVPFYFAGNVTQRGGTLSNGVLVGRYTLAPVGVALQEDESEGTFVDETADINSAGTGDVTFFPATDAVNDAFYYGDSQRFSGISVTIGTAGTDGVVAWEYWNGRTWVALSNLVDSSTSYKAGTSTYFITFAQPRDWAKTTVDGNEAYFVRSRITTVFDTNPVGSRAYLLSTKAGEGLAFPSNGIVTGVSFTAQTVSGGTSDTVLQIVNLATGDATTVTLTKALAAGYANVANPNGLSFERGDPLLVQVLGADGTAYALANFSIEYKA